MFDGYHDASRSSTWGDTNNPLLDQSRNSIPNYSLSKSPPEYVLPKSRQSFAQPRTPYTVEDVNPSLPSQKSKPPVPANKPKELCPECITTTRIMGCLFGIVITAIPLGVMIALYAWTSPTSSSDSATTVTTNSLGTTTTAPVYNLPAQCSSTVYIQLNDASRLSTGGSCCPCDSSLNGWYRITGASGTRLITSPVGSSYCGSSYPVWFNGSLPSSIGGTVVGTGCSVVSGNLCHSSYSVGPLFATNCSGFYVFYLYPLYCGCCSYPRYCTI